MRCKRILAAPLLACLLSCAPDGDPVRMAVLQWEPTARTYDLRVVEVRTLENVAALRGDAATPIGAASIRLDLRRLEGVETEKQFRKAVLEEPGSDVEAQFIEDDGVLYPSDFHSLSLATAYYNFEVSRAYALARGMPEDRLRGVPFYYFPKLTTDPSRGFVADNAAWYPALRSFLLFPFHELQGIPLAANQGVIAHEYGHGIFTALVHDGSWLPDYPARWGSAGAVMIESLEEGFADAWALGVTGDLDFVERSLDETDAMLRDVAFDRRKHCYSQDAFDEELWKNKAYLGGPYWDGRKYQIGTMWAAALHRAGQLPGTDFDRVMDALLASYRAVGTGSLADLVAHDPVGITFGTFAAIARAIVAGAPDSATRTALCSVLMDRFSLEADELGGRCDGAPRVRDCG